MAIKRDMSGISAAELRMVVGTIFGKQAEDVGGYIIIGWPAKEGDVPMLTTDAPRPLDVLHGLGVVMAAVTAHLQDEIDTGKGAGKGAEKWPRGE